MPGSRHTGRRRAGLGTADAALPCWGLAVFPVAGVALALGIQVRTFDTSTRLLPLVCYYDGDWGLMGGHHALRAPSSRGVGWVKIVGAGRTAAAWGGKSSLAIRQFRPGGGIPLTSGRGRDSSCPARAGECPRVP